LVEFRGRGIRVALFRPMLHKASRLRGIPVHAIDGEIGRVEDLLFDDQRWTVRYLVVAAGSWLMGRRVLLSPMSIQQPWDTVELRATLTTDQVRNSPDADAHRPLTRRHEQDLLGHYGYPFYWDGAGIWGAFETPGPLASAPPQEARPSTTEDRHLQSVSDVTGYHIHAADGAIGHVDDFLIDEATWRVSYVQVDTSNWIGGRAVVISPGVMRGIDWTSRAVNVGIPREAVKASPLFESVDLPTGENAPPFALI
jgi:sporulation protein YlmC with PRC-barrel domain